MADHDSQQPLVEQLLALLEGGNAHAKLSAALKDIPEEFRGEAPHGLPYSAWQLVEHLRITQRDILDFSAPPAGGYQELKWPEEYWPQEVRPASSEAWDASLQEIDEDRKRFSALLQAPDVDLYSPFPWGDGQNLLREALLLADHNAYHTGELIVLRRLLGIWHH